MVETSATSAIKYLRSVLWSGREFGRAAVLVGAGFSRNAEVPDGDWVPDGRVLARELLSELPEDERTRAAGSELRDIAQRLEASKGREYLLARLPVLLREGDAEPSEVHQRLLECPWSDVFTTNYDTLLEKASRLIVERKYDVVDRAISLTGSARPRVVKLHGTFASGGDEPLVTESDYLRFDTQRPHVFNTLLQALLENEALVLVGYAAKDWNVNWLAERARNIGGRAKIYLVGILGLQSGDAEYYASLGIDAVDLGQLFPSTGKGDDLRHRRAVNWFLRNLQVKDPPEVWAWPSPIQSYEEAVADEPALVPVEHCLPIKRPLMPEGARDSGEQVESVLVTWRGQRELYPGWIVCPEANLDRLWTETQYWLRPILEYCRDHSHKTDVLAAATELVWRLETSLMQLSPDIAEVFISIAEAELANRPVEADPRAIKLGLSLTRYARQTEDEVLFGQMAGLLEPHLSPCERSELQLERARLALGLLQMNEAQELTNAWLEDADAALASTRVRGAGLLAELGCVGDATELATKTISDVRVSEDAYRPDFYLYSTEAWALLLEMNLMRARFLQTEQAPYRARFEQLARFRCDPWRDKSSLASELKSAFAESRDSERAIPFDPDCVSRGSTVTWTNEPYSKSMVQASRYLSLIHDGGLPLRVGMVSTDKLSLMLAAENAILGSSPQLITFAIRVGDTAFIKGWLSRAKAASLDQEDVDAIWSRCERYLRWSVSQLSASDPAVSVGLGSALEVLARLAVRANQEQLNQAIDVVFSLAATRMGHLEVIRSEIGDLLRRAASRLDCAALLPVTARAIEMPLPDERIPDFVWSLWRPDVKLPELAGNLSRSVQQLIATAAGNDAGPRRPSIQRLTFLSAVEALNADEREAFGAALWAQTDDSGIPTDSGLRIPQLLFLPAPESVSKERLVKDRLLQPLVPVVTRTVGASGRVSRSLGFPPASLSQLEDLHWATRSRFRSDGEETWELSWSPSEAQELASNLHSWFESSILEDWDMIGPDNSGFGVDFRTNFTILDRILSDVVAPPLETPTKDSERMLLDLYGWLADKGGSTYNFAVELVRLGLQDPQQVVAAVRMALNSTDEDQAASSHDAVARWALLNQSGTARMPSLLLEDVVREVQLLVMPSLKRALETAATIARKRPELLTVATVESLVSGLALLLPATDLSEDIGRLPFALRPGLRLSGMRLAHACTRLGPIGWQADILLEWRQAGECSTLPEERAVWAEHSELAPSDEDCT